MNMFQALLLCTKVIPTSQIYPSISPALVFPFVPGPDFGLKPPDISALVVRVQFYIRYVISNPCPYESNDRSKPIPDHQTRSPWRQRQHEIWFTAYSSFTVQKKIWDAHRSSGGGVVGDETWDGGGAAVARMGGAEGDGAVKARMENTTSRPWVGRSISIKYLSLPMMYAPYLTVSSIPPA